jgi:hypothetical protein
MIRSLLTLIILLSFFPNADAQKPALPSKAHGKQTSRRKGHLKIGTPSAFLEERLASLAEQILSRPLRSKNTEEIMTLSPSANKSSWLDELYKGNLVEASTLTEALADKLVFSALTRKFMADKADLYLPKTLGLKAFLETHQLLRANGELIPDGDRIEEALHQEFPSGFVVRPAVGIAPHETSLGMYPSSDLFIVDLLKEHNVLYDPSTYIYPVRSHLLKNLGSGEALVLQDNVVGQAALKSALRLKYFEKIRVHTYETQVLPHSVPERWVNDSAIKIGEAQELRIEKFVQDFLNELPPQMLARQAWGVDVAYMDNGEMKIIDLITNGGRKIAWSTYLDQPRLLQLYTQYLESNVNVQFTGFSGFWLRHGWGNYWTYWRLRIERAPSGWRKLLALIPPL